MKAPLSDAIKAILNEGGEGSELLLNFLSCSKQNEYLKIHTEGKDRLIYSSNANLKNLKPYSPKR